MMRVFSYKRYYLECTCKLNFTEIDSLAAALLRVVVYSTVLYCTWYNVHARLICTHDLQGSTHSNSLHQEKIDENLVFFCILPQVPPIVFCSALVRRYE
jgi:hypothetical protein